MAGAIWVTALRNQQAMSPRQSGKEFRRLISSFDGHYGVICTRKVQVEFKRLGQALHDVRKLRVPSNQIHAKVAIALGDADLPGMPVRCCTKSEQYQGRFAPKFGPNVNFQEIFL